MTRQQTFLSLAMDHVVAARTAAAAGLIDKDLYGSLCHGFPVMVRTNGLCQALAFMAAKAGPIPPPPLALGQDPDKRAAAYRTQLENVASVLWRMNPPVQPNVAPTVGTLLDRARTTGVADYMRDTRTVLEAWVYYKRFAVSMLNVPADVAGREP